MVSFEVFAYTLSVTHPNGCVLCTSSETILKYGTCSKSSRKEQDMALPNKQSIKPPSTSNKPRLVSKQLMYVADLKSYSYNFGCKLIQTVFS